MADGEAAGPGGGLAGPGGGLAGLGGGLDGPFLRELDGVLAPADAQAARYPGEPATRQPVHTVYVPAMMFRARTPARSGEAAACGLDRAALLALVRRES